jgi:uncharacterized membrane protein YfcA
MEILGYIGAVVMGLSLGLIGGGGSILTVPILGICFRWTRCWQRLIRCLLWV